MLNKLEYNWTAINVNYVKSGFLAGFLTYTRG